VRGEAHFTVARDAARPFTVETGGASVRAVGTAFDVRVGPTATEVIVTAGRVQLARGSPSLDSAADGVSAPLLTAGWRAFIPARAAEPISTEQLESAVIREALSWQDARLLFSETPLAEVIARFNRRNRIQLVLADPELAALPISGSFRSENVEAFARLLATGGEIAFEHDGTDRIVLRRTR
jgi:transmembrane sensor